MRYYYTCPIAAAYMAKNHGFLFMGDSEGPWSLEEMLHFASCLHDQDQNPGDPVQQGIFYIHPSSEHLLVPRVGDVILDDDNEPRIVFQLREKILLWHEEENEGWCYIKDARIIHRDNKPFIMPEREV